MLRWRRAGVRREPLRGPPARLQDTDGRRKAVGDDSTVGGYWFQRGYDLSSFDCKLVHKHAPSDRLSAMTPRSTLSIQRTVLHDKRWLANSNGNQRRGRIVEHVVSEVPR